MKKLTALLLVVVMAVVALASCAPVADEPAFLEMTAEQYANAKIKSEGVMTYAEYAAAAMDAEVVIEAYVQATQSWWEKEGQGRITAYLADLDGAYFVYEMACSEEDAAKLTAGTKIKVTGYKGEWAGEVEIMDPTFEFVGAEDDKFVAPALKVNSLVGKDALVNYQNQTVAFVGLEVVAAPMYKWDGSGAEGDDIYLGVKLGETALTLVVESYLHGNGSEVYEAVEALEVGATIDVEAFLYWYDGMNPHIVAIASAN